MENGGCYSRVSRSILLAILFIGAVAVGLFYIRAELQSFFMTRPSINAIILSLGLLGIGISIFQMVRLLVQARQLDTFAETMESDSPEPIARLLEFADGGLVKGRFARVSALAGHGRLSMEAVGMMSDSDLVSEEARGAFVRYVLGVMIFLGLIGTFWGVLITVQGVQRVLQALEPGKMDDAIAFVTQLKDSMGGMLGGLSTAFSTSLFGLAGSVILGFVDLQTRKARAQVLSDLDRFVVSVLVPKLMSAVPTAVSQRDVHAGIVIPSENESGALYHLASQETLGENLRRLTDVIIRQSTTDERITGSIVEVKALLESMAELEEKDRETAQAAAAMSHSLLERIDSLNRNMERLIKEVRITREASDDLSKTLLDRLKLEGEITNKTLSLGFSDLSRQLGASKTKRGGPEGGGG
jgi:hypothetical protein